MLVFGDYAGPVRVWVWWVASERVSIARYASFLANPH